MQIQATYIPNNSGESIQSIPVLNSILDNKAQIRPPSNHNSGYMYTHIDSLACIDISILIFSMMRHLCLALNSPEIRIVIVRLIKFR